MAFMAAKVALNPHRDRARLALRRVGPSEARLAPVADVLRPRPGWPPAQFRHQPRARREQRPMKRAWTARSSLQASELSGDTYRRWRADVEMGRSRWFEQSGRGAHHRRANASWREEWRVDGGEKEQNGGDSEEGAKGDEQDGRRQGGLGEKFSPWETAAFPARRADWETCTLIDRCTGRVRSRRLRVRPPSALMQNDVPARSASCLGHTTPQPAVARTRGVLPPRPACQLEQEARCS